MTRIRKITDAEWVRMDAAARRAYLARAIRCLPAGARPRSVLADELLTLTGSVYAACVTQRDIRCLAACFPTRIDCSFTLGLDEVIIR